MDLRHIRYFLAVAKLGTVTAAAEQLFVTQPSISRQIHRLESDLGIALFERQGSRLVLTQAGRQMHEVLEDIVIRADRASSFAQEITEGTVAQLRIAAGPTTATTLLAPFIATLCDSDPLVFVDVISPDQVHEAVTTGHDLGIATSPFSPGALSWKELMKQPLNAFVNERHPWFRRSAVSIDELATQTLILPPIGSPVRSRLEAEFLVARPSAKNIIVQTEPVIRQAFAAAGRGVAIAGGSALFDTHAVSIIDRNLSVVSSSLNACWSHEHYGFAAIEKFVDRFAAFLAETA